MNTARGVAPTLRFEKFHRGQLIGTGKRYLLNNPWTWKGDAGSVYCPRTLYLTQSKVT
jgi:hypothetical protein